MKEGRREYELGEPIVINGHKHNRIIIDQHYKLKHPEMNDLLIIEIIKSMRWRNYIEQDRKSPFSYFAYELLFKDGKSYRVIFLLCDDQDYIGIINAFRVRKLK